MSLSLPPPRLPAAGTVDVWTIDLDAMRSVEARETGGRIRRPAATTVATAVDTAIDAKLEAILPVEERQRAARFVLARDAARFRRCRAMLRLALARYLQRAPEKIEFTARWRGKPCLAEGSGLYFNVTHAAGLALFAFSTIGEIGVDVEGLTRNIEALEIASAYFTPRETALIADAQTQAAQAAVFLRLWTRKEAVLKAAGCGISQGLNQIDVSQPGQNTMELKGKPHEVAGNRWLVRDIDCQEGYVAAVAAPPGEWSTALWTAAIGDAELYPGSG